MRRFECPLFRSSAMYGNFQLINEEEVRFKRSPSKCTMKSISIIFSLVFVLFNLSCEKDFSRKSFEYEECASDLQDIVNCVFFIDEKAGFAAGNGNIYGTVDGGMTWDAQHITDLPIHSIYFVDEDTGFAVGGIPYCFGTTCDVPGSRVFKTIDAGESWQKVNIPYAWSELIDVTFIDKNVGFATGLGLHLKTEDGGESWKQFALPYKGVMNEVIFVNGQTGYISGLYGNILKTKDQGETWVKSENESDGHIYDLYFIDQKVGFAAGQKEMIKTKDGGETWKVLPNSPSGIYYIHFSDKDNGIALGDGIYVSTSEFHGITPDAIYQTTDGGKSWEIEDDVPFGSAASFYNDDSGYSIVPNKTFKIKYE